MKKTLFLILGTFVSLHSMAQQFKLNDSGYFNCEGIDVMAFSDFYPEGHQGGISLLMNGQRIATNGDIRLEPTPGQWQAVPKQVRRNVTSNSIETMLCYPDSSRHLTGFNPMIYPDLQLQYTVRLEAEGDGVVVTVDLNQPVPAEYIGKVGFNLEFFPGQLFGKPWLMDGQSGIFPQQPNSPLLVSKSVTEHLGNFHPSDKPLADVNNLKGKNGIYSPIVADDVVAMPYAVGRVFTSCPDDPMSRVTIEAVNGGELKLYDGRMNHNNGWFVLRSEIPVGATTGAIRWKITPSIYILALAYEAFKPEIDATAIDQQSKTCEIHQPDGKNDILQQIEHGALSVVSGYRALGRLYRGIICPSLRQYAMLGDAAAMTDRVAGTEDDRWIFTENNPQRELSTAAQLAATARVLKDFNPELSAECLEIAQKVFATTNADGRVLRTKTHAAAELYITTGEKQYLDFVLSNKPAAEWYLARVEKALLTSKDKKAKQWCRAYRESLKAYSDELASVVGKTPYGVPYSPSIWGAGWDIQRFGFENFFLADAHPELFPKDPVCNALNFVLGCHPGSNQASFASGVGAKSATVGYGLNRADWSYIPGGVISGTALIRPDFPELLTFPFLWQQTEYVLGGGSSHYMFLVLAVKHLMQ